MPITYWSPGNDPETKYPILEVNGVRYPYVFDEEIIRNMVNVDIKDSDVMLCGYMRSGTHWCFEIINMLLRKCDDTIPYMKEDFHIEQSSNEKLAHLPLPRVLNGHMHFELLPKAAIEKKLKIVYVLRDPRDVACSWYKLMKKYFRCREKVEICPFADWMKLFLNGECEECGRMSLRKARSWLRIQKRASFMEHYGTLLVGHFFSLVYVVEWGTWFDHVTNWEKAMANPDHSSSILVVRFEDLVTQPVREIERIDEFLNTKTDDKFRRRVVEKCSLDNMIRDKHSVTKKLEGKSVHFVQGKSGSWKDIFSAELVEYFNRIYDEKMKDSKFYNMYRQP